MDEQRGTDRAGRRRKRFLTPEQKYEVWLQLLRGEVSIAEAADRTGVDRGTIMKLRTVAKQGALDALAASRPGVRTASQVPGTRPQRGLATMRWCSPATSLLRADAANPLGPFAMWTAFPSSDYYDPSAPPRRHQPTTSLPAGQLAADRRGDHRDGSHVHHRPFDG